MATSAQTAMAAAQDAPAPPAPATPPSQEQPAPTDDYGDDIVVTGELRGAVQGDVKPEKVLNPADIRAYGAGSIAELLTELEPQTRSGRGRSSGRPVLLLSGRRISSFSEIRDIPPEAIERIDILPEEAALKLGYSADQRVVNIVLRRRFRAITGEATGTFATAGGRTGADLELGILRLSNNGRINLNVELERDNRLLESQRDIITSAPAQPWDRIGNVTGLLAGGEIDPRLSALAGTTVTVAGAPTAAASGAVPLNGFLAAANNPNSTDLSPYRTLAPDTVDLKINGVLARNLGKVAATINLSLEQVQNESLNGLPSASLTLPAGNPFSPFGADTRLFRYYDQFGPLTRSSNNQTLHGGFALNSDIGRWRWSVTGNWDRAETRSVNETGIDATILQARLDAGDVTFNPFGPLASDAIVIRPADRARSVSNAGSLDLLLNGPIAKLPAGDVMTSFKIAGQTSDLESESFRNGVTATGRIGRDSGSVRANIDLPIASRGRAVLSALGNFSLNANAEVEQLSDFGTLFTYGYGANWSPIDGIFVIASTTREEGAPTAQQLGNPVIATPNVRVFDFVRGETVDITRIDGGNPGLSADNRRVMKIGLYGRPFKDTDLTFNVDYNRSVIHNPIAAFPTATAELEAAFPSRFVRDGSGQLLRIDNRPVNFERSERQEIRWGINFSKPISSPLTRKAMEQFMAQRAARQAARQQAGDAQGGQPQSGQPQTGQAQGGPGNRPDGPRQGAGGRPGGGGGFGGRGGGFGGGRGGGGPGQSGRIQLSLYHTIALTDRIVIRDGLPDLDLLNGSATGSRGGSPRHQVELRAGVVRDGIGIRLNADWKSATRVVGGATSSDELRFGDQTTVGLRAFATLGPQFKFVRDNRWLVGTRVTLAVDNLFDSRLKVTDKSGATPLSYQPGLLDPVGRTVRISIRKMFF
ncbi:MAG: TonB-dependent receptor [Sphingomonas sp.]|nr:TonB-dependent receptor [Sphingomonas sp.]